MNNEEGPWIIQWMSSKAVFKSDGIYEFRFLIRNSRM